MKLFFATTNKNKTAEIRNKLGDGYIIEDLSSIVFRGDLPETHETLEENAVEKAMYIYEHFGKNCFAEDSGLIIDALNGEPGVYSARYAGEEKNDELNIDKVLKKMKGVQNRTAKFKTVIAIVLNYVVHTFEGEVSGIILTERRGDGGFGYDSIFQPDGYTQSFAELSMEEKNKNSHRSLATEKMVEFLNHFETVE